MLIYDRNSRTLENSYIPFFLSFFFIFFGLRLLKKKKRKGKRKIPHGNGQEKHIGLMAFQHAYYMILYLYLFMGKYIHITEKDFISCNLFCEKGRALGSWF